MSGVSVVEDCDVGQPVSIETTMSGHTTDHTENFHKRVANFHLHSDQPRETLLRHSLVVKT